MRDPCEQIFDEEHRELLAFEEDTVLFPLEEGVSISNHVNTYTKLLTDLANVDVVIEEENKAFILLSSILNKGYETFVVTLINGRTSLSYSDVTTTLVNLELIRKDKEYFGGTLVKALTVRGRSQNQRGEHRGSSKSKSRYDNRSLTREQYAFCKLVIGRKIVSSLKIRTS